MTTIEIQGTAHRVKNKKTGEMGYRIGAVKHKKEHRPDVPMFLYRMDNSDDHFVMNQRLFNHRFEYVDL